MMPQHTTPRAQHNRPSALRRAILARMGRWLREAAASDGAIFARMLAAARELRAALEAL
jgi:hypothetical protein